jgi:hypothetical protein
MDLKQDIIKRLGPDIVDKDKPSEIGYWPNGNIKWREWCSNCGFHRDGGLPAYERFYENGSIERREWRQYGKIIMAKNYNERGEIK